ncbi:gliding motility-associated C-terminal domain-containing protein [Pontibacter saemangeumensis]|uniref:T9SS type B sorting domain-containing protein n=1 Tax=Pontibacter saemangeumensis TaxID=1084525 RepID=UPI003CD0B884
MLFSLIPMLKHPVARGVEQNTLNLVILNRWGNTVFHAERYDNSWSAAEVPAGIYFYQFTSPISQKIYKGWVEVVR